MTTAALPRRPRTAPAPSPTPAESTTTRPAFATRSVLVPTFLLGSVLTVFSGGYGYHRDELYFRMLKPAWGYVDQPPLSTLVARAAIALLGDSERALRVPATLATMLSVVVVTLVTREFGGGRRAQALCAWAYSTAAVPMIFGHVLLTATLDLPVWPAVVLFAVRAITRAQPRWWLAVGAVVGVSTYDKLLVAVLLVALAAGLLAVGPRRVLLNRWLAAGALLAAVLALPNLLYQATHGWPQFAMGAALSGDNGADVRTTMWWFLLVMLGPPLVPIWVAGLVVLARRPQWRFVAAALPVLLVIVFAMGAQTYYPFGLLAVVFAVGCVPAAERTRGRRTLAAGVVLNAAVSTVLALPIVPLDLLHDTPVPAVNQVARDSVGWPQYVAQIAAVYRSLPRAEQGHTAIYASNYGEAGAVGRFGTGLPVVYSGHNQLWYERRPGADVDTVVFVGGQFDRARPLFATCTVRARLDDGVGVDNEEQGEPVAVCTAPIGGWTAVWPRLKHLG